MAMRATNLANEFAKNGYFVDILVTGEIGNYYTALQKGVAIVDSKRYICSPKSEKKFLLEKKNLKYRIRFLKFIQNVIKFIPSINMKTKYRIKILRSTSNIRKYFLDNPNSVIIPFGMSYVAKVYANCRGIECNIIYAEKNAPQVEFENSAIDKEFYLYIFKRISAMIAQTKDTADFYKKYVNNVYVINNPVKPLNLEPYEGIRRKTVVNFCRMSSQKRLDVLIDAFKLFHDDYTDYDLEIYGNTVNNIEEEYKKEINQKIIDLDLSDCAKILPPAADVHKKIIDVAMFVSSSDFEGLSNSMIEAMAIGLPCICTDCLGGGTREVMVDQQNGLIVPMNDVTALYKAMCEFANNTELSKSCSYNAARIKEKLASDVIANKWLKIIESC